MSQYLNLLLPVDLKRDWGEIKSWYEEWGQAAPIESSFPKDGFIVQGVGAGFLILTNSGFAILEHFISNPRVTSTIRQLVMDKIAGSLIRLGKEMGIMSFIAITKHPAIERLCLKHNLTEIQDMKVFGGV